MSQNDFVMDLAHPNPTVEAGEKNRAIYRFLAWRLIIGGLLCNGYVGFYFGSQIRYVVGDIRAASVIILACMSALVWLYLRFTFYALFEKQVGRFRLSIEELGSRAKLKPTVWRILKIYWIYW